MYTHMLLNAETYAPFMVPSTVSSVILGLNSYLLYKRYNQNFGDCVPLIAASVLNTELTILTKQEGLAHPQVTVQPLGEPTWRLRFYIDREEAGGKTTITME